MKITLCGKDACLTSACQDNNININDKNHNALQYCHKHHRGMYSALSEAKGEQAIELQDPGKEILFESIDNLMKKEDPRILTLSNIP